MSIRWKAKKWEKKSGQATLPGGSAVDLVFSTLTPDRMWPRWLLAGFCSEWLLLIDESPQRRQFMIEEWLIDPTRTRRLAHVESEA